MNDDDDDDGLSLFVFWSKVLRQVVDIVTAFEVKEIILRAKGKRQLCTCTQLRIV